MEIIKSTEFWDIAGKEKVYAEKRIVESGAKGTICSINGLGDHSGRYEDFYNYLNRENFSILCIDNIGTGKSSGKRGHIDSIALFHETLDRALIEAGKISSAAPKFFYGHSMGGAILLSWIISRRPQINGFIAASPWLELTKPPSKFLKTFTLLADKIFPTISFKTGVSSGSVLKNKSKVEKNRNDGLSHKKITPRLFMELERAKFDIFKIENSIQIPALLMHGLSDRITSYSGTKKFYEMNKKNAKLKLWENAFHELHGEDNKEDIFAYTLGWILSKC